MAKLGDVCTIYAGTGFPVQYQGNRSGAYPFYKVSDIAKNVTAGNVRLAFCENYVEPDVAKRIKSTIIPPDTIVFAKIGEAVKLNRRAITSCNCIIDNNAMGIRPNEDFLSLSYFYHFMCNLHLENLAEATTVPSVKKSRIESIEIPLPSLQEQAIISNKLDKISDVIIFRKRQLAKLDELVKARFVELFGHPNLNEKGWEIIPLGNLCSIVRGGSPRPITDFLGGTVPWIKIGDATIGDNIYLHSTKERIIPEGIKKSRMVKAGSLIFANCGVSLGFARIITFDGCIHDGWLAMENIDSSLNKVFLLQCLNQMTEHFRAIAPAGTQPNLNTAIMNAHMQIVPPLEMQKAFVDFVDKTAKFRLTIQQGLDKMETLKQALMQEYFT